MTWWITWRILKARLGAAALTALAVALATAIALVVPLISRQVQGGAANAAQVFDLLVTSKGSSTQAVLSSLFYLDVPLANMPYSAYERLLADPRTRHAVPLGFGDNYQGFPLVGTKAAFFDQRLKPTDPPYFQVAQGRLFSRPFEAVVGASVARLSLARLGGKLQTSHGLTQIRGAEVEEHPSNYTVVGVLAPTGGPVDRAVLVDLESLWRVHGQLAPASRGVTAVLYTAQSIAGLYTQAQSINASPQMQAIFPGQVFGQLRDFLLQGQAAYAALSLLVLLLAGVTVWLSVHAAGVERARAVGLMRALGAGRRTVFGVVLLETLVVVAAGILAGIALGYGVSWLAGIALGGRLGFRLTAPQLDLALLSRVALLLPLAVLAALPPALSAARQSPLEQL